MPQVGQRISEYVLEDRLGAGTFGEVWRARHHVWADQLVAIKIPTEPGYIQNLQKEGTAIHGLQHANIVRALGFDPYADPPYLIMEYVPGTSLRTLIADRSLTTQDAVLVMRQILQGLAYAHAHGVVHRDIKPENVLVHERAKKEGLGAEGVVKVTDFGLGKAANLAGQQSIAFSVDANSDDAKKIAGTIDYMSPEQRSGGDVDGRADLYACGVTLYEMLTGERPAGTDLPSDLNPKSPRQLDEVFRRSYSRLDKRYASAEEFLEGLEAASRMPPPLPKRGGVAEPPPLPPTSRAGASTCPSCHRPLGPTDQFCMNCGVQLVEWVLRCPQCGGWPEPGDKYCIQCGATLGPGQGAVA
ncbi:MAG: serine/threonine-protein kinase [Tepidisphaeraceae bacterium]|jgi:serine/threonine protein kinase